MSKEDFDQKALEWDSSPARVERARVVAEAIRFNVPLSSRLTALEYGCGTGLLSFALQPDLGNISLADSSQGMLDVLCLKISAAKVKNMQLLYLDLCTDPLPDATWDLVYSLMVLHHITDTEQILASFYLLLNPAGFLCIADLDEEDGTFHASDVEGVHHGFNRQRLEQQTRAAGFKSVQFSTVFTMQKETADATQKSFPLFLMTAKK